MKWKLITILLLLLLILLPVGYFAWDTYLKPQQILQEETEEKAEKPPGPPPDPSITEYAEIEAQLPELEEEEARKRLKEFIQFYPKSPKVKDARQRLGQINADEFFSMSPSEDKEVYTVKRGDSLYGIASKHGTTVELLVQVNNLANTLLHPGDTLIIPKADFSLEIDPEEKLVTLYNDGEFFKQYEVINVKNIRSSGGERETKVVDKPAWHAGEQVPFDNENFVGSTRWISLGLPGSVLYSHQEGEEKDVDEPPAGLQLEQADMEELHSLINRGDKAVVK